MARQSDQANTASGHDPGPVSAADIEHTILALLDARRKGVTICPSEVARALLPDGDSWRPLMPQIRHVAQRLAEQGRLAVTRQGRTVDATGSGGPIRLGSVDRP